MLKNCENVHAQTAFIYIVFSSTCSKMGKAIRLVTNHKYNHVSLALDKDLHIMYSFARYHINAPLMGGFVEESALRYYDYNKPTHVKICKVPVSADKYKDVKNYINNIIAKSDQYVYNTFSAMLTPIHRRKSIKNAYTCIEFASHILGTFNITAEITDGKFYSIADLEDMLAEYVEYEGDIKTVAFPDGWGNDLYNTSIHPIQVFTCTVKHFMKLARNMLYS